MYAGRVPSLMSHGQYSDGINRRTDRLTDGRRTITLRFSFDAASVVIKCLGEASVYSCMPSLRLRLENKSSPLSFCSVLPFLVNTDEWDSFTFRFYLYRAPLSEVCWRWRSTCGSSSVTSSRALTSSGFPLPPPCVIARRWPS